MTAFKLSDLRKLRNAIKAENDAEVETLARRMFPTEDGFRLSTTALMIFNSYLGDLNSAQKMHDKWLKDMPVEITDMTSEDAEGRDWRVRINWKRPEWRGVHSDISPREFSFRAYGERSARAWLRADLKALIAIAEYNSINEGDS